ncbi:MAG: DNA-processing protein DprA [Candidatus Omnitrophota bacterium]
MNRLSDLILLNIIGVGYMRLNALLEKFGSTENIFKVSPARLEEVEGIKPDLARKIIDAPALPALKIELELIKKHNVRVLSVFDENYPKNLKQIYDPPIILYVKGELIPEDEAAIAVVGSRMASCYGTLTAERLANELAGRGITVVSGMARGIDTFAHQGALKAQGRTLAVLGSGLAEIYPPENKRLAEKISQAGAVLSEFPMREEPFKYNFPRRNRTISGLSLGVVVVEASKISGALITARFATEQNREVFAVPGQAKKLGTQGTNNLIRDGAKLVESAEDIIEELESALEEFLRVRNSSPHKTRQKLGIEETKVLSALSDEPLYIDEIGECAGLPINKVSSALVKLVLSGSVKELPGKNFVKR